MPRLDQLGKEEHVHIAHRFTCADALYETTPCATAAAADDDAADAAVFEKQSHLTLQHLVNCVCNVALAEEHGARRAGF